MGHVLFAVRRCTRRRLPVPAGCLEGTRRSTARVQVSSRSPCIPVARGRPPDGHWCLHLQFGHGLWSGDARGVNGVCGEQLLPALLPLLWRIATAASRVHRWQWQSQSSLWCNAIPGSLCTAPLAVLPTWALGGSGGFTQRERCVKLVGATNSSFFLFDGTLGHGLGRLPRSALRTRELPLAPRPPLSTAARDQHSLRSVLVSARPGHGRAATTGPAPCLPRAPPATPKEHTALCVGGPGVL